jgi:hypothetical protein
MAIPDDHLEVTADGNCRFADPATIEEAFSGN